MNWLTRPSVSGLYWRSGGGIPEIVQVYKVEEQTWEKSISYPHFPPIQVTDDNYISEGFYLIIAQPDIPVKKK